MKKVQRLNESQLRAIVAESVKNVLKESTAYNICGEIKDIWMGIQRIGMTHGNRLKDEMKIQGQEYLIPQYEKLEVLADKMRTILRNMMEKTNCEEF